MSETVTSFYAYRAEAGLLADRRCIYRVSRYGLLTEFCGRPDLPAHGKCADHPDELNELTLATLHCLEVELYSVLARRDDMRVARMYLRVAHEIVIRTERGRRGVFNPGKLDWPGGARGRHRNKALTRAGLERADVMPARVVAPDIL